MAQAGGPAMPPGLANAPQPAAPVTYREKWQTATDVAMGWYQALMETQGPENGAQPATLLQNLLSSDDAIPKCFLVLIPPARLGESIRIKGLHSVAAYRPNPIIPMPWDSLPYAFELDLIPEAGAVITTVEFPPTTFRLTAYVQVSDAAAMDTKWIDADAGRAPATLLGPYDGAEPTFQ